MRTEVSKHLQDGAMRIGNHWYPIHEGITEESSALAGDSEHFLARKGRDQRRRA